MIKVIFRDGSWHYFDQIRRERTGEGILAFQLFGEAEVVYPVALLAEIHIREKPEAAE